MCGRPAMRAGHSPDELRAQFQEVLNAAIAHGRIPGADTGLGSMTLAAVAQVAHEHPEATAEDIAAAYDAFDAELRRPRLR